MSSHINEQQSSPPVGGYISLCSLLFTLMPLLAFAGAFVVARFIRNYRDVKQQQARLDEALRNSVPGDYLSWLSK